MIQIEETYCICDIESNTLEEFPNPEIDELRYIGFKYSDKYLCCHYSEMEQVKKVMTYFPYIIGHNFKRFDKVILERYGINFRRNQYIIDTYEIVDNRFKSMLYMDLNSGDRSLDKLAEKLNLSFKKSHFDYDLLKQDVLKDIEYEILKEYLFNDLNVTDELFKYCYNMFYGCREFMSDKDKFAMNWLTKRSGSTAYKCICNLAGLPEEYEDVIDNDEVLYSGGYVSEPYIDFIEG